MDQKKLEQVRKDTEEVQKMLMGDKKMRYELVVVWASGDKDVYQYESREAAEKGERGMRMANGNQISWKGIRRI